MPSLRHAFVAWYAHHFLRSPRADLASVADRILRDRQRERPAPPRRLSDRLSHSDAAGFDVWTLGPRQGRAATGPVVVYLHGGGYVADLTPQHWQLVARLSDRLGATVVVPRYPLAPEATWRDSREALDRLVAAAGDGVVLAGDSAGGGLALALAQDLVRDGGRPRALVLLSPWVDVTNPPLEPRVTDDPWLDDEQLRQCGLMWAGADDPADPAVSPLRGDLSGLPPTLVMSGTRDVLHPQSLALVATLRHHGVRVEHDVEPGLIHVHPLLPVPEARRALDRIVGFIERAHDKAR